MGNPTMTRATDFYRAHLFAQQGRPTVWSAEKARIRTLDWKPPKKIHVSACMLCCLRPIDGVSARRSDPHLRGLFGEAIDFRNEALKRALEAIP